MGGSVEGQPPLNPTSPVLNFSPGAPIVGTIDINVVNNHSANALVPVVYTPSWGDPELAWVAITKSTPKGERPYPVDLDLVAPAQPGNYYITFGSAGQINGCHIASATN